jgi:16S rRNA (guanine527-N7)-methyltransferase
MNVARISELLRPFCARFPSPLGGDAEAASLSAAQLQNISTYIDMLKRWNARINLTAIRDEEQIVTRHFGESLFAAAHLFPAGHRGAGAHSDRLIPEVVDLGSGAGFPGIPCKLWAPQIRLTLVESNHKKATFLREVTRALTLTDVDIQAVRAETLRRRVEVVTLRAVERFEPTLAIAVGLLAPSGRLALLIGGSQSERAHGALPSIDWANPHPIPQSDSRILLIGRSKDKEHGDAVEPKK